jgi:hypothetical protein
LYDVLGQTVSDLVCPRAGKVICEALTDPSALPTIKLPSLGTNPLGGVVPRAQLGEGYRVPASIDPFHLARLGLDPGIGTMLFQGVAETR